MRAHFLQHVPFEGPAAIAPWMQARGHGFTRTAFCFGESLPAADGVDFLVIMGGPMSVHDEAQFPWLVAEKAFIREVLHAGKPVLGICLGAQLISEVLGGVVGPNPDREIGWFPVLATPAAQSGPLAWPEAFPAFHWHGETFSIPAGATLLGSSQACAHQAFVWNDHAIGLQFHLETTPESAAALVEFAADDLVPGHFVQSAADLLSPDPDPFPAMHRLLDRLLGTLAAKCPSRG